MKNWVIGIAVITAILAGFLCYGIAHKDLTWLQAIILGFTYYGMFVILVGCLYRRRNFMRNDCYRPMASILIPARNEENVIAETVRSLAKQDYRKDRKPNFEIVVLDDDSSDNTYAILTQLTEEIPNLKVVRRPPEKAGHGKSAVLNDGLASSVGEVVVVFDADTRIDADFLKSCIPFLYDPKVAGTQSKVRIYNRDKNFLTSLQDDEFNIMSHLFQLGRQNFGGFTALGGNGQIVKREALLEVGGWNEYSLTEDYDLTFRLMTKGYRVRYVPEAIVWQEAIEGLFPFLRQRIRWAEGFLKCIFDYGGKALIAPVSPIMKLDAAFSLFSSFIPLFAWLGYFYIFYSLVNSVSFMMGISTMTMSLTSWGFMLTVLLGMYKVAYPSLPRAVWKALRYSYYSFAWIIAVPLGYLKCFRHVNSIKWDKTFHKGDERKTGAIEPLPPASIERERVPRSDYDNASTLSYVEAHE